MCQSLKRFVRVGIWAVAGALLLGCGREDQPRDRVPAAEPPLVAPLEPVSEEPLPKVETEETVQRKAPEVAVTPPRPPPVSAPPPPRVRSQLYRVQPGDTLMNIARKEYGDIRYAQRIHEINRKQIDNPDRIFPGQELRLPQP